MPNKRSAGLRSIGAWCQPQLLEAIERWIAREKVTKLRRVNRSDFLLEAILEKLQRESIPIETEVALRAGQQRQAEAAINPAQNPSHEGQEANSTRPKATTLVRQLLAGAISVAASGADLPPVALTSAPGAGDPPKASRQPRSVVVPRSR